MKWYELHEHKVKTDVTNLDRPGDILRLGDQHFVFMTCVNWNESRVYLALADAEGNILDRWVNVRMRQNGALGRALFTFRELCDLIESGNYYIS